MDDKIKMQFVFVLRIPISTSMNFFYLYTFIIFVIEQVMVPRVFPAYKHFNLNGVLTSSIFIPSV